VRAYYVLPLLMLTGCGLPPSDIAIGAAATYALFGDDIEQVEPEDLKDPKTYTDAVPPQAKSSAKQVATNMRDNVRHNSKKLKEWWFYDPEKDKKVARAVPTSYCYAVMQDIVCYRQPMPGWETRLVGYQGTGAAPPPVVATKPLPTLAQNTAKLPENRLISTKPVFKEMPAELDKEKKEAVDLTVPVTDSAQEILPDPTNAPQL
jgi:hypothetical protein